MFVPRADGLPDRPENPAPDNVVTFPGRAAARVLPRAVPTPCVLRRYTFADLVRVCVLEGLQRRSQVDHLRRLVRFDGLPAPITHRLWNGQVLRGADAVCAGSQWDAAAVDAWAHRPQGPGDPAAGMAALPPLPLGTRAAMARNAQRLAGAA